MAPDSRDPKAPSARATYRDLFERLSDATFLVQKDAPLIVEANPAAERFLQLAHEKLMHRDLTDWVAPEYRTEFKKALRQAGRRYYPRLFEGLFRTPSGQEFWMELQACPLTVGEEEPVLQVIARDMTFKHESEKKLQALLAELQSANKKLEDLSTHDAMTGLWNYRTFALKLEEEHARASRYKKPYSLVYCDLDHFKNFNDRNGHPAGDTLLRAFSKILIAASRNTDLPCRYGGEEFAVLCPETPAEGALILAERIRKEVEKTAFEHGEGQPGGRVTVSIGVATFPDHANQAKALLEAADQALYASKKAGRNRVSTPALAARKKAA